MVLLFSGCMRADCRWLRQMSQIYGSEEMALRGPHMHIHMRNLGCEIGGMENATRWTTMH